MHTPVEPTGTKVEQLYRRDAARIPELQSAILLRCLEGARKSEFSIKNGLTAVRTIGQLRDAIPIAGYERIEADVDRMLEGAERVLFDAPADGFVQTGGTSGKWKVFPRRELTTSEIAGVMIDRNLAIALAQRDHPEMKDGLSLDFTSAPPTKGKVGFGGGHSYATAYRKNAEFRRTSFVDPAWLEVLGIANKAYALTRIAVGANIRVVGGLPDILVVVLRLLADDPEKLIRDVRDGTITADLDEAALAALPKFAPAPDLAVRLEEAARARGGKLTPKDLWPELGVVRTFLSGALSRNRAFLSAGYGVPLRESGYSSTEGAGPLGFSLRDEDTNLAMSIHCAFFELVDEAGAPHLAHEVKVGETYRVVLTTPHGLFRYDTNDLIEVRGWDLGGAPVFRFLGRRQTMSLIGEFLTERDVMLAVSRAGSEAGAEPAQYVAVPHEAEGDTPPYYELVCAAPEAPGFDRAAFARAFDRSLPALNVLYKKVRHDLASLGAARVLWVSPAWFDALRDKLVELSDSAKLPIFLPRRDALDALVARARDEAR